MGFRHKTRAAALVLVSATILLASAISAYGAPLPSAGPTNIKKIGFESASDSMVLTRISAPLGEPATAASWGRVTNVLHAGQYSLWCAGTSLSAVFPYYKDGTRGIATADIPQLADYYSSTMSLYYVMPTIGANDGYAFRVGWQDGVKSDIDNQIHTSSTWALRKYEDLVHPSSPSKPNLSRSAGAQINVQFYDNYVYDTYGKGPSVDDISVDGYKYGPVDDVAATSPSDGVVALAWTPPPTSTGSSADDTRTISYRIWRTLKDNNNWTELTSDSGRWNGTTYTDNTVTGGASYTYAVQAWDPGTDPGHGRQAISAEFASTSVQGSPLTTASLTAPSAPSDVRTWAWFKSTGTLGPAHPADSAAVQIQCSKNKSTIAYTYIAYMQADGTTFKGSVKIPASGTWYVRARHYDDGHLDSYSAWRPVSVKSYVIISRPSKPTSPRVNRTYSVSGTLKPITSSTHLRVYAYRYKSGKVVQTLIFKPTGSTTGMPSNTTKYTARIKLTKTGTWKLRAKHLAHGVAATTYSALTTSFTVK